eukprot:CAMPEP_0175691018 /NCGR_PEP_ID=MMETSP0097-20121207/30187_1 /TAXON_ID=311494 /ORGANISM="Alexandrium monilatum, Strain CCMP3105" /LENGTH=94 /DNA_ID=CAMNT_0016998067 /DNA_START=185 /DNA_END=466 /DNA_ORIENTATION=+
MLPVGGSAAAWRRAAQSYLARALSAVAGPAASAAASSPPEGEGEFRSEMPPAAVGCRDEKSLVWTDLVEVQIRIQTRALCPQRSGREFGGGGGT